MGDNPVRDIMIDPQIKDPADPRLCTSFLETKIWTYPSLFARLAGVATRPGGRGGPGGSESGAGG